MNQKIVVKIYYINSNLVEEKLYFELPNRRETQVIKFIKEVYDYVDSYNFYGHVISPNGVHFKINVSNSKIFLT